MKIFKFISFLIACSLSSLSMIAMEEIIPFNAQQHTSSILAIAHEVKDTLCAPLPAGLPEELYATIETKSFEMFEQQFTTPGYITSVLYSDHVIGFVRYFIHKEKSLELLAEKLAAQGTTLELLEQQAPAVVAQWRATMPATSNKMIGHIEALAIAKEAQHKGYGRKLLRHALDVLCKNKEIETIELNVNETNATARKLYESEGFFLTDTQELASLGIINYKKTLNSAAVASF